VKLLRERPDLAVLVKSVSITIAVHIILRSISHTGKANDTADGMVSDEATAAQSDTTTETGCNDLIRPGHEDSLVLEGSNGTEVLKNLLRLLPKAHHVRMVPPPIIWTPWHIVKRKRRKPMRLRPNQDPQIWSMVSSSIWWSLNLNIRLHLLPRTCTSLDMDVELHPLPFRRSEDADGDNHDSLDGCTDEFTDEETTVNGDESLNDDSGDDTDDDSTDEDTDEDTHTDNDTDGDVDDHTSHYSRLLTKPRSKLCR
jgi:hypothetical protein